MKKKSQKLLQLYWIEIKGFEIEKTKKKRKKEKKKPPVISLKVIFQLYL